MKYRRWDDVITSTSGKVNVKVTLYLTGELTAGTRVVESNQGNVFTVSKGVLM